MPSLAKLPSMAKWSSLAKLPSLAKSPLLSLTALCWCCCWSHWHRCPHCIRVPASIALASSALLQWRRCLRCDGIAPPCCTGICPITTPLAMHGSTLRALLLCLLCPARPRHHVASSSSSMSAGPDMPNALPVWRPCWLWQCTVVVRGRVTVPSIGITVNGIVVVIYVSRRRYADCLAALDGLVCPGTARHQACCCPCCAGILALVALASPPALRWRRHPPRAGIIAPVMLASAPLQCHSQHVVIAELASLLALRWRPCQDCAGTFAGVALALLPLLRRCHRQHRAGIFALHVLAPLPLLHWHHCPSHAGFCPLAMLLAIHCHCRAGVFAGAVLASLQALRWRCHRCCAETLPSLHWRLCPCTGATTSIALASLPLHWRLPPCCTGIIALGMQASVQLQRCLQHVVVHCVVVEFVPLRQWQRAWHCWPCHPGCCLHPH
jgi:hypothetical protein